MNVLSLFDGKSCGRIALERAGVKVTRYFASEIDKYAIQVSRDNWPDIVQLGDVRKIQVFYSKKTGMTEVYSENGYFEFEGKFDLIIAGSPCQGFSFAGKQLNFDDPRSKLFFEFERLTLRLQKFNPRLWFFLENVKMKKEYSDVITDCMGVEPIALNSALVSAQNRKRLYWTNIPYFGAPEDKGILLKDILEIQVDVKYIVSEKGLIRAENKNYSKPKFNPDKTDTLDTKNNSGQLSIDPGTTFISCEISETQDKKSLCLSAGYCNNPSFRDYKKSQKQLILLGNVNPSKRGMNGNVYSIEGKSPCLTTNKGEGPKIGKESLIALGCAERGRKQKDGSHLQTLEFNGSEKSNSLTTVEKDSLIFLGFASDIKGHDHNRRIYSSEGKSPTLLASSGGHKEPKIAFDNEILKPSEIERAKINHSAKTWHTGNKMGAVKFPTDVNGKAKTLTVVQTKGGRETNHVALDWINGKTYRKLTPVECERLQTVPDNYTACVSNSQRYKMLGNGWTIDIIAWLFKPLSCLKILGYAS